MPAPDVRRAILLGETAGAIQASVVRRRGAILDVRLEVRRPGGAIVAYDLEIDCRPPEPTAKERKPDRLPSFCPNRHINPGGGFCQGYADAEPLRVTDAESASAWWRRLWKYLSLQASAAQLRRWPGAREWAHGDAAKHQRRAEAAAEALGPRFQDALAKGAFEVRRRRRRADFGALYERGVRLYSVWTAKARVATLRQACICGSGLQMRRCGSHAQDAAALVLALDGWRREEAAFWRRLEGKTCCGSLDECPLRAGLAAPGAAANDTAAHQAAA
jgi:hypothetical protein